ncbi:hypothetical protein OL233_09960 [Vagococcus sp. PNs007]|uniref:DUF3784 domain-containing protein n=1 Tax=Vagococcus proximus TaxID=2991417 RepID=A0ABT5X3M4_9ENTE|nr:hypothetical protein [Vagococcus proximus]MDF0480607.1 hypothetical protein [Vagococcus proximus]
MIRILLAIIIIVLLITAKYLNSHSESICKIFGTTEEDSQAIDKTLQKFSKACLLFSALGLAAFLLNHQLIAIIYICLVILTSAIFSIKFAKSLS